MIAHTIPGSVSALTLEKYMRRAWPLVPGRILRELFRKKDVRVNGIKSGGEAVVRGGDALAIYADAKWFESMPDILWTDERLIVSAKPQGLPVDIDQDGIGADTLLTRLCRRWPGVRLCHRLDAATGGIVLAAADDGVYEQTLEAFRSHRIGKEYHALALNRFERAHGTLDAWLFKDARRSKVSVIHRPRPGAMPIKTLYRAGSEAIPGVYHVWLTPVTGRTHQLRAHMTDFGHPLLGDDRYGDRAANRRHPGVPLCLWHERLAIPADSPMTDYRGMTFEMPAPDWIH